MNFVLREAGFRRNPNRCHYVVVLTANAIFASSRRLSIQRIETENSFRTRHHNFCYVRIRSNIISFFLLYKEVRQCTQSLKRCCFFSPSVKNVFKASCHIIPSWFMVGLCSWAHLALVSFKCILLWTVVFMTSIWKSKLKLGYWLSCL